MKVCTDSCILGAYTPTPKEGKILDIGTGTGLLSLMLAQRTTSKIEAIELDENAANQANDNVLKSPFANQITVTKTDIKDYEPCGFDLIISNPPFYENQLNSPEENKNKAMHSSALSLAELAKIIASKLNSNGKASVLLPPEEMRKFTSFMQTSGLFEYQKLQIRHNSLKPVFREISMFQRVKTEPLMNTLAIYETDSKTYTHDFETLLKDYYLIF
ncbi:tRNA1(Val) (adenine(37)-N6)-methyltransferase [Jiulongibacter sp. NS-SX5]|uniref:tRNA1(Val) (adenine(37)-N6)-methyltransferase n=1 Tax=Jiulongibacter sp. NS-SX5 TaxID=3463854 RepID=UPI00405959EB